jgi:hypothetical protein
VIALVPAAVAEAATANLYGNAVPAVPDAGPDAPLELGTYFTSSIGVDVTGFRFYAGPLQTSGSFTGKLWLANDQSLITFADFGSISVGWNEVLLPTPVSISANTTYVVSVNTGSDGHYAFDSKGGAGYFPIGNAPVTAIRSGLGNSGTFPSLGPFPGGTTGAAYFRDIIFNSPLVQGDVNGDFAVNIADYQIIRDHFFQSSATLAQGDLTANGTVDFDDFRIWKNAFPGGTGAAQAALDALGVPEPATSGMLVVGLEMLLSLKRRRSVVR